MTLTPVTAIYPGTGIAFTDNGDGTATIDGSASGTPTDGWVSATAWTYASASTFTVSGDLTAVYTKGTRLKFTQTTVKYGVVKSSSHSAGTTTVTIVVNTDYVLANAAISANYYSYALAPAGYPDVFNWSPSVTGLGAGFGVVAQFAIHGGLCWIHVDLSGTSSGTTFNFTLPVTAIGASDATNNCWVVNAGTNAFGLLNNSSTTQMDVYPSAALGTWTNSSTRRALGMCVYKYG